jgi:hypothetical protein
MYPLGDRKLNLHDIARHWSRDMRQHPPPDELLHLLLEAVWLGDLRAVLPGSNDDPRPRLLEGVRRFPTHAVVIVEQPGPPRRVSFDPDGSVSVDMRQIAYWPQDPGARTPQIFANACTTLADLKLQDYHEVTQPILVALMVQQNDFAAFCDLRGYPRPEFWFQRTVRLAKHI